MTKTFFSLVYYLIERAAETEERRQPDEQVDEEWGHSESLDPDNVGDIADEGAGHRGSGQWGA